MIWFLSGKCGFYFWNQFIISVYSNLQKSPPWKLKSPPKSGKSQNLPLNTLNCPQGVKSPPGGEITPVEDHWFRRIDNRFI